jgi:DnaJ-class molecular chaperone
MDLKRDDKSDFDICDNPCNRCHGDGMAAIGTRFGFCPRCHGSGIDPGRDKDRLPVVRQPRLT